MAINMADLPGEVFDYIAQLRKEATQYRIQRNGARKEAEQLRESNARLRLTLADLRAELARADGR